MDPFSMVVMIVAITVGAGVLNNYLKVRQSGALNAEQTQDIDALKTEVARLTDRVRVLEKLATDDDARLKAEFDKL